MTQVPGRVAKHGISIAGALITVALLSGVQSAAGRPVDFVQPLPCSTYIERQGASYFSGDLAGKQLQLSIERHRALLILPDKAAPSRSAPWVWFAPMVPGEPNQMHEFIIRHILSAGMAFATIDAGESYGNPAGTRLYAEFHDILNRCFNLSRKVVLLPQSRGGLMLFNWAVLHADEVERIAGIYPVCDLRSYPGLAIASGAYGVTEAELRGRLEKHNPIDFVSVLAARKIPILMIHGDTDKIVPIQDNSGEFVRRYQKLGGPARLIVISGNGHEEVTEFFQSTPFVTFLTSGN